MFRPANLSSKILEQNKQEDPERLSAETPGSALRDLTRGKVR
jgi:hypothetical protein